jgi:hypothetical protein
MRPSNEKTMIVQHEEFMDMDFEELLHLADHVGVSLQGAQNMAQARTRLLNDAVFTTP